MTKATTKKKSVFDFRTIKTVEDAFKKNGYDSAKLPGELALKRWSPDKDDTSVMRTHSAGKAQAMQSKVKESKVKKSKVKESKEENIDTQDPRDPSSYHFDPNQALFRKWQEWINFRKALKKPSLIRSCNCRYIIRW